MSLLALLAFGYSPAVMAEEKPPVKDYILMINPDAETCAWGETLIPVIREELQQKYPNLDVHVEYMYALGITDMAGLDAFKEHLFSKYPNPPKYLMLFESDAYAILHKDIDEHWGKQLPTLLLTREDFIGDETYYLERKAIPQEKRVPLKAIATSRDNLSVVYDLFDIPGTISIMKQMYPDMKELVFITDNRYISAENRKEVEQTVAKNYPDMKVVNLTPDKLTTDQLIHEFTNTHKEAGFLYFTWFNNELTADKDLVLQTNAYRIFSLYINSPVFTINDVGLKESGMLGGSYTRFEQVKETTTKAMDDLIAGNPVRMVYPPAPVPTFNYLAMLTHNIPESAIPSNSYLYHRPLTFLERNQSLILGLAIILFLSFIFMRIILLFKNRQMQNKEFKLLEKYGDLFNNMPIAYRQEKLFFNRAGDPVDFIVTEVNPGYEEQLSPKENIVGKKGSEVHTEMFPELINIYRSLLQDKNKKVSMAYYHSDSDRYFSVIISPSSTEGYMDLFFVDTTELQGTQQLLQSVNNKLTMSLDIASITPWKWDLRKKVIHEEGTSMEGNLSYSDQEYFERIHEKDREAMIDLLNEVVEGRRDSFRCEYRINDPLNKQKWDWLDVRGAVERKDENGIPTSLIGSSLIITDRKNIEQELLHAKEKAEESNKLKSAFLANMSHEIRTPLNAIVGFSNILAATEKEEDKQEYVSIIENNNNLLLQLVSDILDLSKLEAGTMEFNYSDIDLNFLLWDLQESTQDRAEKGVSVVFEDMIPDCFVHTERGRLLQVMNNLLSNAAKFTKEGEIRFGYRLNEDNQIHFYVSDTGCGISQDQQDKIFGRFVKLNHFVQGTGLGLSLCQVIVQKLGGEIGVTSEEGKGTTFWFTLPYEPIKLASAIIKEEATPVEKDKLKVLIAEDNLSNFELFEVILKNDYNIIHAWNGEEAINMFKEHKPHIVLMDINMPKMNGYEATVELRKISKDVPIIAVTAYAFSTDEKQIKHNGFSGYSPKPLNAQRLKTQMTELLMEQAAAF